MTATTATVTRFVLVATPVKGETYRVTTTSKTGEQVITGRFRGQASTGLRFVTEDGKVVTRAISKIVKIEAEETHEVPVEAPAAPAVRMVSPQLGAHFDALEAADDAAQAHAADEASEAPQITEDAAVAAIQAAAATPVTVTVVSSEDVYDADPIVDGKRLSEMRFAEVMLLAKKYRTPGRGVARIEALRAGVAKAIAQEAGRLVGAAS